MEIYRYEYLIEIRDKLKIIVYDGIWDFSTLYEYYLLMEKLGFSLGKNYVFYSMIQMIDINKVYTLCRLSGRNFRDLMKTIIGNRFFVVFWGNCQVHALSNLLIQNAEFDKKFITCKIPRFWEETGVLEHKVFIESKILSFADYLVTQ